MGTVDVYRRRRMNDRFPIRADCRWSQCGLDAFTAPHFSTFPHPITILCRAFPALRHLALIIGEAARFCPTAPPPSEEICRAFSLPGLCLTGVSLRSLEFHFRCASSPAVNLGCPCSLKVHGVHSHPQNGRESSPGSCKTCREGSWIASSQGRYSLRGLQDSQDQGGFDVVVDGPGDTREQCSDVSQHSAPELRLVKPASL
jgi:hypothetical protein